ncbi:hypothetical protein BWD42_01840 [Sphingobacterium sp. CZ-UAM]|nr:hypothetical protein BWD42_01840 [Sphingobacterium sp. CZ-UAM]
MDMCGLFKKLNLILMMLQIIDYFGQILSPTLRIINLSGIQDHYSLYLIKQIKSAYFGCLKGYD